MTWKPLMKFSIITPEHTTKNIPFLIELYESIIDQTYTNWEWVLYLNNGVLKKDIPPVIRSNCNVKIFEANTLENQNIGLIKHNAFHLGTGDVLVEVDHDDILTPDCLQELYNAYYKNPEVGFVYSNNATYHMTGEFFPFCPSHGWSHSTYNWKGRELLSMNSFKASSHSVSYIWYAPDHVRSWKTSVYKKIGGHNKSLSVCDDHELLIRTYAETDFYHIDKVLYIYRITGDNTWIERNQEIQTLTRDVFDCHIREAVEAEADRQGLLKIDIGGGLYPYPGYTTVDLRETADIQADLNDGIPLPDNSVWVLNAHHILEHLKDPIKSMKEIHRVLKHGGWAFIEVPSTEGKGAFQDPTHVSYWNDNSFLYYTDSQYATFIDNTNIRFQQYKMTNYYPSQQMRDLDILVTCAVLVAIKEEEPRFPGPLSI